jgi:hypothetical protein
VEKEDLTIVELGFLVRFFVKTVEEPARYKYRQEGIKKRFGCCAKFEIYYDCRVKLVLCNVLIREILVTSELSGR